MRRSFLSVLAGILIGAFLLGGGAYAATTGILAKHSPHPVTVDGQPVEMEAYLIEGQNYYRLRDIGELLGFGVAWDEEAGTVRITTSDDADSENEDGTVSLPADGSRYIPQAGDVIRCDDGTNYTITDVSQWGKNMFASEPLGPLPEPTCDWGLLDQPELPEPEARRFQNAAGDNLRVRNLYETRRMEYTIYNAAASRPELWKDGVPALDLHLGISAQNRVQMFWPWQEEQLTQVFCSAPGARFEVEAWDVYHNGKYLYTEYDIRGT